MSEPSSKPSPVEVVHNDPERPAYAEDGTDLSLIRSSLRMTPTERLRMLDDWVATIARWRDELGHQ